MRLLLIVFLLLASAAAQAQRFPSRPITMIVPYAPGGSADVVARPFTTEMAKVLGENVVVELRPGAGGNIGAEYVAKSARADGYTILLASLSLATNVSLMKLPFDPRRDLAPIGGICTFPNVLVVSTDDPARSLKDIIERAREEPGKLTYGSSGPGTSSHLAGELLAAAANIQLVHVPYKGSGAVHPDLIARRLTMLFDLMGSASGHIKGGQVKPLASTGARRAAALAEVPTFAESGFPGFEFGAWLGLFAPAETPKDALGRLEEATLKAIATPEMKTRLAQMGGEPIPARAADFGKFFNQDVERYARLVREGKVKPIQ
ncbi:MAG: tripartite tricarboxylate transporter substrate binding protein [Betaproteobacteria bacterium]|nr:MAG: tripartite tricarboxylate transporter substrate binding protein [Betaproteobacteria bacterium]